jgi:hypothetical protein
MTPERGKVVVALSTACYGCSGGQLILLEYGRLAEAEMLGRSTIEGTLKFIYLLESADTFLERFNEYADTQFDFASLKDHFAITRLAESLSGPLEPALRDLLLSDEELEAMKPYTKSERKSIEERWSVNALIGYLSEKSKAARGNYRRLLRTYATASHLTHMDFYGIVAMRERDSRPQERAKALNEAQAASCIANIIWFSMLRLDAALTFAGVPAKEIATAYQETEAASKPLEAFIREWMNSEYPHDATIGEQTSGEAHVMDAKTKTVEREDA